jgi:hypothetical protein
MTQPRPPRLHRLLLFVFIGGSVAAVLALGVWVPRWRARPLLEFRDAVSGAPSAYADEQVALLCTVHEDANPGARELLRALGCVPPYNVSHRLVWFTRVTGRDGRPTRLYLFDEPMKGMPPRTSPLICVVADDNRTLIRWASIASDGFQFVSARASCRGPIIRLEIVSATFQGRVAYVYEISDEGIREISSKVSAERLEPLPGPRAASEKVGGGERGARDGKP